MYPLGRPRNGTQWHWLKTACMIPQPACCCLRCAPACMASSSGCNTTAICPGMDAIWPSGRADAALAFHPSLSQQPLLAAARALAFLVTSLCQLEGPVDVHSTCLSGGQARVAVVAAVVAWSAGWWTPRPHDILWRGASSCRVPPRVESSSSSLHPKLPPHLLHVTWQWHKSSRAA